MLVIFFAASNRMVAQNIDPLIKEQQTMIAELTGYKPLSDASFLGSRSSADERERSRTYLKNAIKEIGLEPKEQSYRMPNLNPLIDLLFSPFKGGNVYTILESTSESDEYVVLGAHFDTEIGCPGAIDNGTGVTLIFSILKRLKMEPSRSRNLIVVFFDQEEEDLIGSQAFAKYLKNEEMNVHSVHTFDMVGWDEDGNKEMELELPTPELEKLYKDEAIEFGVPIYVTKINSTDHHSFRQVGFPAIGVNEAYGKRDSSPYKDTPEDTYETVNFKYLAESTLYVLEVIRQIVTP